MHRRSYHFIPANKPKLFERLEQIGADAYIFDLEDAVADTSKEDALEALSTWLAEQGADDSLYVRLNGVESRIAAKERDLLEASPWLSVVLPKLSTASELERSVAYYGLSDRAVIGLVEDASALHSLNKILETGRLSAVGLGLEDFLSTSIYTQAQVADLVCQIRSGIALTAAAYEVAAIDTISLDYTEEGKLMEREALAARSAGMTAKFSIHPNQVRIIHECFAPDDALIEQALRHRTWLEQTSTDVGYMNRNGEVFSPPKINKLKTILKHTEHYGLD